MVVDPANRGVVSLPPVPGVSTEPALAGPVASPPPVLGDASDAKTPTSPYLALIDAIQAAQEKDNRAMREMLENRSGRLAVIRSLQASDANTVATFEKLITQLKEDSSNLTPVPVKRGVTTPVTTSKEDVSTLPPVPTTPVKTISNTPTTPNDMHKLVQELEQLSQKVKDLSSQLSPQDKN